MKAFRSAIREYIEREAQPREKFGHQARLYALTEEIGAGLTYDDDVVFAAAWLHDLGVFTGHRPEASDELARWDNTAYAMQKTPGILHQLDFPAEKISAVVEAIRTHQPAFQPTSLEGHILRDADILEQLGAVGALRTICKIGRDTRFPDFSSATEALSRALRELPSQIELASALGLLGGRVAHLQEFLRHVEEEAGSLLF